MKLFLTILLFSDSLVSFGQSCMCERDTILSEIISCDTIKFDNGAFIYWNFDCDSSWLTFENRKHRKAILYSLDEGLQHYTGRLGYDYAKEYKSTFLIRNNVISGCCTPPEFYLYDKETGTEKTFLGRLVYNSDDRKNPFVIYLGNGNYDSINKPNYDFLALYNTDTNKKNLIPLTHGEIENSMENGHIIYPELLFDEPVVTRNSMSLRYSVHLKKGESEAAIKTIVIDLSKYR